MRISVLLAAFGLICFPLLGVGPAHAQATRTWVSGVGDDANPCSRTAPCKTFAGAISKTAAGGEIDCLDPGGFGSVTITKSITLDCTATLGSILASGFTGINVNGAGILVNLRGLIITGAPGNGLIGINFIQGAGLNLDNVTIQEFNGGSATGLLFAPNSAADLQVNNSYFTFNGIPASTGGGLVVQPAAGGTAVVAVSNTRFSNNTNGVVANSSNGVIVLTVRDSTMANGAGSGVSANAGSPLLVMLDRVTISANSQNGVIASGGNANIRIQSSSIFGNTTGVSSVGGGVLRSYRNNAINGNGSDGTPIAQEFLN